MLTINIFQAYNGDCLGVSFLGNDRKLHHIIIDAGYIGSYLRTLKIFCESIKQNKEKVDLFIITHTDEDHIQGVSSFIKDYDVSSFVNQFWFNWSHYKYSININQNSKVSINQGIELRNYLLKKRKMSLNLVHNNIEYVLFGAKIIVLSPDEKKYEKFKLKWDTKELKDIQLKEAIKTNSKKNDYNKSIESLVKRRFKEDTSIENGSSIAFLFEYNKMKILFLADSHPSTIIKTLKQKGYSKSAKIKVDYVKVSHHGAKGNTSPAFLDMIECTNFIISSNGTNSHCHPSKEALARIAYHNYNSDVKSTTFIFNYENCLLKSIFTKLEKKKYNIKYMFPPKGAYSNILVH